MDLQKRCLAAVAAQDGADSWGLDTATRAAYAEALTQLVSPEISDPELTRRVGHYHAEHARVAALHDVNAAEHADLWREWSVQALRIMRSQQLDWVRDRAIDEADLAQSVLSGLVTALPSYRYASSFRTWAYSTIVNCARNEIRYLTAAKRAAALLPLDNAGEAPGPEADQPETATSGRLLAIAIDDVLRSQPDQRLRHIFALWAIHDHRVVEIGRRMALGEAHTRVLLNQALLVLRQDETIQHWRSGTLVEVERGEPAAQRREMEQL